MDEPYSQQEFSQPAFHARYRRVISQLLYGFIRHFFITLGFIFGDAVAFPVTGQQGFPVYAVTCGLKLLPGIMRPNVVLNAGIHGESDTFIYSLLEVDEKSPGFIVRSRKNLQKSPVTSMNMLSPVAV